MGPNFKKPFRMTSVPTATFCGTAYRKAVQTGFVVVVVVVIVIGLSPVFFDYEYDSDNDEVVLSEQNDDNRYKGTRTRRAFNDSEIR
jgi:hypothetical protein